MASIRLATAANVRGFQTLTNALATSDGKWTDSVDYDGFQDEIGRFRVWSGNLGALQKGHSSLDYRLRDSPLLSTNALKFLKELEDNINEAIAVVSEARLPYELQSKPDKSEEDEDDDDDGFFDEDDDDDDEEGGSRTELSMRFAEIVDIIDNLYKLSVRIRTPTIRSRSLKAATYKPKDPDTGVDILSAYASYDFEHVKELLSHLRQPHQDDSQGPDYEYLTTRLSAAITLRRRQFKYWKRHRDKLGMSTIEEEQTRSEQPAIDRPTLHQRNDTLEVLPEIPAIVTHQEAHSQKTGKTLLSGTEATHHHQSLDEIVDTKSVTSYAVTVKDLHGKGVELPPPPRAADGDKDFECPYCYIICPARYGRGRAWRTHLLQDLQPYVCTYSECESSEQLFRSRREWAEHEASHRKAWRCPEHPAAVYKTSSGLEEHFRREHTDSFPESQLPSIVKVGETTTIDVRLRCPICSALADTEGLGDFHNHIANHLERIATFALPISTEDESDGASGVASRGRSESSESRNMSDFSLPSDSTAKSETLSDPKLIEHDQQAPIDSGVTGDLAQAVEAKALLSAESLHQLPDARQTRLDALLTGHRNVHDAATGPHGPDTDTDTDSSYYSVKYNKEEQEHHKSTLLNVSNIPTVRSLYRTKRLLQRDQSYAPNDSYNQVISFCYHDLTKLEVDAIVNSANKTMRDTGGKTLNNIIHKAAGPDLREETKARGKLQGEAVLTGGYKLPAKHIIHVIRPGYYNSKTMTEFNQLIDCYRNALNTAANNLLRTVAFPCLGTGGAGFPPRVAARITLQEIREYLDAHQDYKFERIIFCVNSAADEKAYMDFLPVYFPPTHDDIEIARSSVWAEDRATLAAQVLETRNAVQKVFSDLRTGLSLSVSNFPEDILLSLDVTDSLLGSIRRFLLWSNDISKSMRDLKLVCTVLQLFSGNLTETLDLAKDHASLGQRSDKSIWEDFVSDMEGRHGTNPSAFLDMCRKFVHGLDTMIATGVDLDEVLELVEMRRQLERYKVRQRGGDAEGVQDSLNEALYAQEFQRQTVAQSKDVVKLQQIQSVSQLYKLGDLEEKATLAHPSALFNDVICLVREDITKLDVDIIVNSTDMNFSGMGTLDRSVLLKGGVELRNAIETLGTRKEGDVRLTEGYLLPAKHILHVVPPEQYRKDTKDMLRKIYREILHTAVAMRATSVALPSIGTGMLNYPRRDCASLALEETKRFLESAVPNSMLQKIIFVVYSSNDEFVYKNVLPIYFPPIDINAHAALATSVTRQDTGASTDSTPHGAPRRTLFGSIGEAFRSVRSGNTPRTSRSITANEEHALISFESHAKDCETCQDIDKLYTEGRDLCELGYSAAQVILWHMNMHSDQNVYSTSDTRGESTKLEFPIDMFPISTSLLATVEKSSRDGGRTRPFVTTNRPYGDIIQDQGVDIGSSQNASGTTEAETPAEPKPKKARAHALIKVSATEEWNTMAAGECQIRVYPDRVDIVDYIGVEPQQKPLFSLALDVSTHVQRHKTTPEVVLTGAIPLESAQQSVAEIMFRCPSDAECNSLLRMIRRAIEGLQGTGNTEDQHAQSTPPEDPAQGSSNDYLQWNKRLHDVRAELLQSKRASGGLSDLQSKMERLSAATSDLQKSQKPSGLSELFDPSRSPLATRILVCLTADLKSRPGSYIGMKTADIAAELSTTLEDTEWALEELLVMGEVHQTVDNDTWVVSHPPTDIPVLSTEQTEKDVRGAGTVEEEEPNSTRNLESKDPPASTESEGDYKREYTEGSASLGPINEATAKEGASPPDTTKPSGYMIDCPKCDGDGLMGCKECDSGCAICVRNGGMVRCDICDGKGAISTGKRSPSTEAPPSKDTPPIPTIAPSTPTHANSKTDETTVDQVEQTSPREISSRRGSVSSYGSSTYRLARHRRRAERAQAKAARIAAEQADQTKPREGKSSLDPAAEKVYTYLLDYNYALPSDGAHHILDIAAAVYLTRDEVEQALAELKKLGLAHVSGKDGWWWASKADKGGKEQPTTPEPIIRDAPSFAHTPESPNLARTMDTSSLHVDSLNPTTEQVYTYLLIHPYSPPDGEHHTRDIATALKIPREEVQQALYELKHLGLAHRNKQKGWWRAIKTKQKTAATTTIRNAPTLKETNPGPTLAVADTQSSSMDALERDTERLQLETIILDGLFSYMPSSGSSWGDDDLAPINTSAVEANHEQEEEALIALAENQGRWTRIDTRIVDPQVLAAAHESFHDTGTDLLVQRVVRRREIMRWAEESVEVREERALHEQVKLAAEKERRKRSRHVIELESEEKEREPTIRDAPSFADTPPSPTLASSAPISRLSLDSLNIDGFLSYASPSGARWTRIDKRLVDPRVLVAADEDFEDVDDGLVVHRVVRRGEIRRWAEESVRVREGEGVSMAEGEGKEKEEVKEVTQDRELRRWERKGKGKGKQREEGKEIGYGKEVYRGERDDKGKGKERDERDKYQEKLDRVIAGDMKEEEMRYFKDGDDDERYI